MYISKKFPIYQKYAPLVPTYCVTPAEGRVIHRFFDTSPFSPSGRYLGLFRMPFEDRNPQPGDEGEIVLVDLWSGEERVVGRTYGWESQVGANVQWGVSDEELYYNDVDTSSWQAHGIKLNPFTGKTSVLDYGIFMISPDGNLSATTCPVRARRTQIGYGVMLPDRRVPVNSGFPEDDGLYITDTATGKGRLLVSIRRMLEELHDKGKLNMEEYLNGESYGFQCKWNPQGNRLLFVLRSFGRDRSSRKNHVITMKQDGTDIQLAIPSHVWAKGGHHINWTPDGEHLTMNLNMDGQGLRFVKVRYDGVGLHKLLDDVVGSGHPTVHPDGIHLLTDAYLEDTVAFGDGTVPLRLVDLHSGEDRVLVRVPTQQPFDFTLRVDPHPAWDRDFSRIAFNAFVGGTRRVFVADLRGPFITG
ncbi:TolB family protein [Paenibacillus caseinilyticus]|uniref:Translocation protein TolB n=1 Tax=Paenibacillus mucilaginosus K02 TaxID=997761 RepID=I0BFM7_9BACL|nr:hypothetical protein [Paenibacillus mucilaginosus]AFH61174.1 hypothetical protein B2K_10640 [Paenibacillus mucilaginosus K02]